jgi:acetylglutamate synthase
LRGNRQRFENKEGIFADCQTRIEKTQKVVKALIANLSIVDGVRTTNLHSPNIIGDIVAE